MASLQLPVKYYQFPVILGGYIGTLISDEGPNVSTQNMPYYGVLAILVGEVTYGGWRPIHGQVDLNERMTAKRHGDDITTVGGDEA